jgi:hypothetical protein
MNDRAFRLDFFIAIAAVVISALTAGTLVYQTHVIGNQFSATIWPYLSVLTTYSSNGETIDLSNDGLGPALIRSAQLRVDGRAVPAWNDYERVIARDPATRTLWLRTRAADLAHSSPRSAINMSSIGPSQTLRPGETTNVLKLLFVSNVSAQALTKHVVSIDLCYCSLNRNCWTLHVVLGQINPDPQPVSACTARAAIQSLSLGTLVPSPAAR